MYMLCQQISSRQLVCMPEFQVGSLALEAACYLILSSSILEYLQE